MIYEFEPKLIVFFSIVCYSLHKYISSVTIVWGILNTFDGAV